MIGDLFELPIIDNITFHFVRKDWRINGKNVVFDSTQVCIAEGVCSLQRVESKPNSRKSYARTGD